MLVQAQQLPFERKANLLMMIKALLLCFTDENSHATLVWIENNDMLKLASANASVHKSVAMLVSAVEMITTADGQSEQPTQGELH